MINYRNTSGLAAIVRDETEEYLLFHYASRSREQMSCFVNVKEIKQWFSTEEFDADVPKKRKYSKT